MSHQDIISGLLKQIWFDCRFKGFDNHEMLADLLDQNGETDRANFYRNWVSHEVVGPFWLDEIHESNQVWIRMGFSVTHFRILLNKHDNPIVQIEKVISFYLPNLRQEMYRSSLNGFGPFRPSPDFVQIVLNASAHPKFTNFAPTSSPEPWPIPSDQLTALRPTTD